MPFKRKIAGAALSLALLMGGGGVFAAQTAQYDHITDDMTVLRELDLLEPIDISYQTRDELQAWFDESLAEYPESEQALDARVLAVFGFIEPGTDLGELQSGIMGEQIAGFYDPETKEMVVVLSADADNLTANDQVTFAHEVVHALQDQHFDLMAVQGDYESMSDDEFMAMKAMIEGDASAAQIMYLIDNPGLLADLETELEAYESPNLDAAPLFYSESLMFSYNEGMMFVIDVWSEGGWDAVDDMYQDPPTTTEQILHPEKYRAGEGAVEVTAPDPLPRLGDDWGVLDDNVMGEFLTDVFIRNGGASNKDARHASEGWGGDNYIVFGNDTETGFVWQSAWDTGDDAEEFFDVLVETESERLGGEVEVQSSPSHVRIIGEEYVGEIQLDGDNVSYTLAENIDTLDTVTGNSVND